MRGGVGQQPASSSENSLFEVAQVADNGKGIGLAQVARECSLKRHPLQIVATSGLLPIMLDSVGKEASPSVVLDGSSLRVSRALADV